MNLGDPVDVTPFKHLYPFRSNYMDVNGLQYHYIDEGSGDPVVMLHGNPTWSFYYRNLVNGLSSEYRTIVPDHIGCGLSDKPGLDRYDFRLKSRVDDLTEFIDQLRLNKKITLVVHDWGGGIGFPYAVRHPEKIGRLIVLNTSAFFPPHNKGIPIRLRIIRNISPFAKPAVLGFNLFSAGAVYMAPRKRLSADVRKGLTAPYNTPRNRLATLKFVQDIPLKPGDPSYGIIKETSDNLHRLEGVPMMICWGKHDFVFDDAYYNEWRRRFPDAKVNYFEQAGHYILEDVPELVLSSAEEFLKNNPI